MTNLRERWEGVSLPGDYLLERWVSGNDDAGFFETPPAPDGRRAIVKLVPEPAVDAAAQLALWQRTRQLRHPNLQELRDCGRAELTGETVLYAVFEHADDTLAAALSQGPLSEAEAREVLNALVSGLGYLQSNGLAYPALEPDRVIAVGERIKLSTDALRETTAGTPYRDELRAFWYKISPCPVARSADILAQALGGIAPLADAATQPAAPAAAASTPLAHLGPSPPNLFPKWIFVGAAAVVLLILGLNLRRTPEAPVQPPPAQPAPAPFVAASVPKASPAKEAKSKPSPPGNGAWRVIVFTYRTRYAATRKAEQINERHPELKAAVLSPRGKNGNYVIALGGRMSREDAERMQKKARTARLARDVRVESGLD